MNEERSSERVVVIHYARTWTEAMVIRGLLESTGIASPATTTTDPFPLRESPKGTHGVEIQVLESQAEEARRIIQEQLASGVFAPDEETQAPSEDQPG